MDSWTKLLLLEGTFLVLFITGIYSFADSPGREYCAADTYQASCDSGEVVMMKSATVGRMFMGRCVNKDRGHIGCADDALPHMDTKCSGRKECQVPVVEVGKKNSICPSDLMRFLQADYECVPVVTCNKNECDRSDFLRPSPTSGYLAGTMASTLGCGTNKCPWMIEVPQGQSINFTLYDFTKDSDMEGPCILFGAIFDGNEKKVLNNCGQTKERKAHVYTSITNSVRVELYQLPPDNSFLLHYSVHGCPDIKTPKNAVTERKGDGLTVKCEHSKNIWHLTCSGNRWIGDIGTCPVSQVKPEGSTDQDATSSSLGMLFVIGLGVVLGIAVGFALLCIVAAYMKRKHKAQAQKADPLLHGNPQYRDYLSKTGTMFGLYPTGQMIQDVGDHTLIYRPVHDYTSTLHPHQHLQQHRPLTQVHELVTHPHHHHRVDYPPDDGWDSSVYNQSIGTSAHGQGSVISAGKGSEGGESLKQQPQHPRDHIYELPNFPDRHRAHSADSGLAYSVGPITDQTSHRTT